MASIQSIKAIQVLDSRGLPTVSCNVILDNGIKASAIVPSGASTGTKEALELRDGGNLYMGKGVQKAVSNINDLINPLLEKLDPNDQQLIDQKLIELDGTSDKSNIGANAILAVSLAVSHAAAKDKNISLHEHFAEIYKNITGKDAESALVKADITANKNMVPYDDKSPFITSGIRFGTPAITTRGLVESDIKNVVEMIDKVILNHDNESVLNEVKKDVNQMMSDRPLFNP
jgi:hypothetical protein